MWLLSSTKNSTRSFLQLYAQEMQKPCTGNNAQQTLKNEIYILMAMTFKTFSYVPNQIQHKKSLTKCIAN